MRRTPRSRHRGQLSHAVCCGMILYEHLYVNLYIWTRGSTQPAGSDRAELVSGVRRPRLRAGGHAQTSICKGLSCVHCRTPAKPRERA